MGRLKGTVVTLLQQTLIIVVAFLVSGIVLLVSGYDPIEVYAGFYNGAFGSQVGLGNTLRWAAPMILTGLAVAVAFRASMWNIGVDGQLYLGAVAAAWVGFSLNGAPAWLTVLASLALAMVVGGIWGAIPGWLRARTGASELVTTLMLNYVGILITDYLVLGPIRNWGPQGTTFRSPTILPAAELSRIIAKTQANVGFFIAIALAIVLFLIIRRATVGYEMRIVGTNRWFAQYGGINVRRTIVVAMLISGMIAGLAGGIEVLGVHRAFVQRFSTGLGFDGIVVSLLAKNNPLGVIASGIFFGALRTGSTAVERTTEVPRAMVTIFQSIIVLGVTAQGLGALIRREGGWGAWWKKHIAFARPDSDTAPQAGS
jgi:ABC-type uncharacterized transport system permease subunit